MAETRPPILTDVLFVIVGVGGLVVAIGRLLTPIAYPVTDPRSQPDTELLISAMAAAVGLFFLMVGLARLWRRRGQRP